MNNGPECLPCCLRRVLKGANLVTSDEWLHRKILAEVMQELERVDELMTPAEIMATASQIACRTLGEGDPYSEDKRRLVEEAVSRVDEFRDAVASSDDPLRSATWLSATSNLLDSDFPEEVAPGFTLQGLLDELKEGPASMPTFSDEAFEDFRSSIHRAKRLMIVHDSAGEILFDRLLIEQIGKTRKQMVSVVRDNALLGDATLEDAEAVGLSAVVGQVISPGAEVLGLPLSSCSQTLREVYSDCDLVIAKGQSCYQTLEGSNGVVEGEKKDLFFLLRVKCGLMARQLGVRVGSTVLEAN